MSNEMSEKKKSTIRISKKDLLQLLSENEHMIRQISDLQRSSSSLLEENRRLRSELQDKEIEVYFPKKVVESEPDECQAFLKENSDVSNLDYGGIIKEHDLFKKADLCVKVARFIMPDEKDDSIIEDQSVTLMHIPDKELDEMYIRLSIYLSKREEFSYKNIDEADETF